MLDDGQKLTDKDIEAAYEKLSPGEREEINRMAESIEKKLKARHTGKNPLMFGRKQSLELLAKLGIWHIKNKPSPIEFAGLELAQ